MIRATVVSELCSYLADNYTGPVAIHPESSEEEMAPPYAVVRIGSGEQMFPGDAEVWDLNVLIGVFHDADTTTAETAESQAAEFFATLADPAGLFTASTATLAWSTLDRITTDASIVETRWQHIAGFHSIVAPALPGD
jgi:hypothetical protein